jgi:predicted RNase H-like HicB family nuclease
MLVTKDRVEERLAAHGYRAVHATGDHALYAHHGDRIVIPVHSPWLSPWSARAIEWSLAPRLGAGWLTQAPVAPRADPAPARPRVLPSVRLQVVVRPEPDLKIWNAFVVDEPRILTFGSSLAVARSSAADAARAWFAHAADIELDYHLQVDADANRWITHAAHPSRTPERLTEARRQLRIIGFADADIDTLLDGGTEGTPGPHRSSNPPPEAPLPSSRASSPSLSG